MARFDVYANPVKSERAMVPFFLDIQSDHIKGVQTRLLVPLWAVDQLPNRSPELNPEFKVARIHVAMDTPAVGAVPVSVLRRPVANLANHQLPIQNALDMLLGGY